MRKMSKGLSFVLVLALVLGSFSMASAVAVKAPGDIVRLSDIAGVPGQEEIEVCQNLGIITGNPDGTFLPDKDVNRAEFAAIITRTMGIPESALAGFSTTSFQDTSGYGWAVPYLAYCHSKGIMLGDGYGNAMPGRTITVNEAMTMICRALGYVENSSNLTGTWPSNYITLAQNLWLYNNLDRNVKLMSKEMSAIAIYNALMVQKVAVASDGKTDLQWKVQPNQISNGEMANFLNTGLECRGDDETYLGSGDAVPGNSLISIIDKIGAYGMGYYTKNDELIAFKMADNFDLLTGYMDGNNFIAENGKKYAFNQSPTTLLNGVRRVFDNAVAETVASGGAIFSNAALTNVGDMFDSITDGWTDGDMLTLSGEVTGLTFRTVRAIVGWHATATDQLSSSDLRDIEDDSALFNSDFPLDYYSEIAERQVSFVGIEGLDDLAIDDVVYVYAEDDGDGPIRKVAASNETLEGTIDEISDADGDVFIVIDGDEYSFSADYLIIEDGASVNDVINDAGADCEALLDAYGNIYDIDATGGELGLFGIVERWGDGLSTGDNPWIRLTNRDEDSNRYYVSGKKVKWSITDDLATPGGRQISPFSGTGTGTGELAAHMASAEGFGIASNGVPTAHELIGYKLNSTDQLSEVKTAYDVIPASGGLTIKSRTVANVNGRDFKLDKNAAVFYNDGDIGTSTVADIDLDEAKNMSGPGISVVFSRDGKTVVAMLITPDAANATSDSVYGVVNSVTYANIGGDDYSIIKGLFAGETMTSLSTTTGLDRIATHSDSDDNVNLYTARLYEFKRDGAGKVSGITEAPKMPHFGATLATSGAVNTAGYFLKVDDETFIPYDSDTVVVFEVKDGSAGKVEYAKSSITAIRGLSEVWAYQTDDDLPENVADVILWKKP